MVFHRTRQFEEPWCCPEVEKSIEPKSRSLTPGKPGLVGGGVERRALAKCRCLDLDIALLSIEFERLNVIAKPVTFIDGNMPYLLCQLAGTLFPKAPTFKGQREDFASLTQRAILSFARKVIALYGRSQIRGGWLRHTDVLLRNTRQHTREISLICCNRWSLNCGQRDLIQLTPLRHVGLNHIDQHRALKVTARLIAADVRIAQLQHHSTDIGVLEFDGSLAATTQVLLQLPTMRRLVVTLACQLTQKH